MSVTIKTSLGDIKVCGQILSVYALIIQVELFCDLAPKTCKNFLALCGSGFYDGTIFHRNIKKFIVQGGDPTGTGKGGSSIYGKYFDDEIVDVLKHDRRGTLSMANRGPNTNGSQFFFAYDKQPHLDNVNTVFGRIIHGLDVLDAMEMMKVDAKDKPVHEIKISSIKIHANPIADLTAET